MLSISPPIKGSGPGQYYLSLAKEDYYLNGGEPPGKWLGAGAESLGLQGEVRPQHLQNLMRGYSPDGTKPLVQNAGSEKRRAGWDFTFSAPKSVSVAWSQSEGSVRVEFQAAHQEAVSKALEYLDEHSAITRRGKGGQTQEPVKLVVATFEHGTSRAGDPQLHTHALVMNVANREDRTSGTIETRPLFQNKMAAGALYRAELSKQLEQRLGLLSERNQACFELLGVSTPLMSEFSKRRKEIVKVLQEKGYSSAVAAKVAALDTREVKGHIAREQLFSIWQEKGRELNWSRKELEKLITEKRPARDAEFELKQTINKALAKATEHNSHFPFRDVVRYSAEAAQGRGIGAKALVQAAEQHLSHSKEIVRLGRVKGEIRYTTREMMNLEKKMLGSVKVLYQRDTAPVSEKILSEAFKKRETISLEQKEAVTHITGSVGGIKVVSGMAGAGKSFMLGAAKEAWESAGFEVYGAAIAGKAAEGLQDGSGIESNTIHKTFIEVESGKLKLNSRSVLVIDEAGMVGTRLMAKLVGLAEKSRATLILVGDSKQLQPVDAGGPLKEIAKRIGERTLTKIIRQEEIWAREAVHDFAAGRSKEGLEAFAERGLLSVAETRAEAADDLIAAWKERGLSCPQDNIIIVATNQDAAELNLRVQQERREAGYLGVNSVTVNSQEIYQNDRVLFTKNSHFYGVKNGSLGTITKVDPIRKELWAELDKGRSVQISLKHYEDIKLGYTITTHKSQGMTAERCYLLVGGSMQDREFSYVQVSRARKETRIFTDKLEAGDELADLTRQMANSRQKDLALSLTQKSKRFKRERYLPTSIGR